MRQAATYRSPLARISTARCWGTSMPDRVAEPGRFRAGAFAGLIAFHVSAGAAWWTGVSERALVLFAVLYAARMFGVTAGYHRYFAHRTFETSRPMRAVLALLAVSSLQRSVTWWAAAHRDHHRFSDLPADRHSPVIHGFWRSHLTWLFHTESEPRAQVNDLRQMPEVMWIDRMWRLPFVLLGVGCWWIAGWSGVVVGLVWSTLAVYHATMCINSLAHVFGSRRYETTDQSRNNWLLALFTFGEGWHNNHHHYQSSVRQGFYWWELDLTWLALRAMARVGLVWDLREPPAYVYLPQGAPAAERR